MAGFKFLLAALLSIILAGGEFAQAGETPIRVGFIFPLTGEGATYGVSGKNGAEVALADLPESVRNRLEVLYEDDGFQPARTLSGYRKLKSANDIDVAVCLGSSTCKALISVTEAEGVPLIVMASDTRIVKGKKHAVQFWVTPQDEAELLVPEAIRRGYRKIIRVSSIHDFSTAMREAFEDAAGGKLEIVMDEEFPPDERDFRPFIAKIARRNDVDAVLSVLMQGQVGIFAKQLRDQQIDLPLFGFEMFENPDEVAIAQGALEGAWYVNSADPHGDFLKRYQEMFPGGPTFCAGHGHDAILVIAEWIKRGASSTEPFLAHLRQIKDLQGATGRLSFAGENNFRFEAALKTVKNGKFVPLLAEEQH